MNRVMLASICSSLLAISSGCGNAENPDDLLAKAVDLRLPMPDPDPRYVDFQGLDTVIKPGEDKMVCVHARHDGPTVAYDIADTRQSKFGHHFILLKAKKPLPPGTVEDCSSAEDMAKYDVLTIPDFELPSGYAFELPVGTPIVMQSHYVNTSREPIRVRDLIRVRKVDAASVKTWAATFALTVLNYEIKPFEKKTVSFDCTMPAGQRVMMVGGHMHEWGTKFTMSYGASPTAQLKDLYKVETWRTEYRDAPPTTLMRENPLDIPGGSILRTECQWYNDTADSLTFPHEMCSTFGVVAGTSTNWICQGDK